ncbi:MAG: hypothetical protein K2Z81_22000, partial [Cyanobacteria bacterium]|nr:hypothetical protein [Cyanobacteriota bacterium]
RARDRSWIDAWKDNGDVSDEEYYRYGEDQDPCCFRSQYLNSLVALSSDGDAGIYLLNPEIKNRENEWEAWHLTSWMPGAQRFQSLEAMLRHSYMQLVKNRDAERIFGF